MSEELGKIEKPSTEGFKKGRKIYFIPIGIRYQTIMEEFESNVHIGD